MILKDFIKEFICKNSLIRLWIELDNGHGLIQQEGKSVCMEWQILKNDCWQSKYANNKVIGVTDIITETSKEAINIVIEI